MTTPTPLSIRSLGITVALAALTVVPLHLPGAESGGAKGSPLTEGWTRVPLKYDIQKAWDMDVSQRHSYDPTTDTHRLWTLRGDKPHAPPPNRTGPRAELRFWNEYYTGEHLFQADVYIVRPTTDACIAQIWGSGLSATTMMIHIRTNGNLVAGGGSILKTNAHDTWFNLKIVHNTAGEGDVRIYINDELRAQRPGRGYRRAGLAAALAGNKDPRQTVSPITKSINATLEGGPLYDSARFKGVNLRPEAKAMLDRHPQSAELGRLNRMLLEDAYPKELARSGEAAWVVKDGILASTGAGRGVIYTDKDYENYRLIFQVRQAKGNHFPGVLLFCQRPPAGQLGLDALGGIQFAVPSAGHWDYRPGFNRSGDHFRRPFRVNFNLAEWSQLEILVNGKTGVARMAVAQPPGTRGFELLRFEDPAAARCGPIALQMHNAQLFDEYRDLRVEVDPPDEKLITID